MDVYCQVVFAVILMVSISPWQGVGGTKEATDPCDVSVDCDCCLSEICRDGTDLCSSEYCVNGYWGGTCKLSCPTECVSCHRNFRTEKKCFECIPGHYGTSNNCSSTCSAGCKDRSCDKDSGNCSECNTGYYGGTCTMPCSVNCRNDTCDIYDGVCYNCVDGMYGHFCTISCPSNCKDNKCSQATGFCASCKDGLFGDYCNISCPSNCKDNNCIQATGICTSCNDGFFGTSCNKSCPDNCLADVCFKESGNCQKCVSGYFDVNCTKQCSLTCLGSVCDIYTGKCSNGCVSNFQGDFCELCIHGKYGKNCSNTCSSSCLNDNCTQDDGHCISGCKAGHSDSQFCCVNNSNCERCSSYYKCIQCVNGTYGEDCEKYCSGGCYGPCEKSSGHCSPCHLNHYGRNCEYTCSNTCTPVDKSTDPKCYSYNGSCILGCIADFFGDKCDSECSSHCNGTCARGDGKCDSCNRNRYGDYCEHECPKNCLHFDDHVRICINGSCKFGCEHGFYGNRCEQKCSAFCNDSCHREKGKCISCVSNHYGEYCDHICSEGCLQRNTSESKCLETNGTCLFGCLEGHIGVHCVYSGGNDNKFPLMIVAVAVPSGVVAVIIALVIIVVIRKRANTTKGDDKQADKRKLRPKYENAAFEGAHPGEEELDEGPIVSTAAPGDENPYYSNAKRPQTKFSKQNFMRIVSKSDEDYKQEFEFLPGGLIKTFGEATKSGNAHKNRYKRIYPYDESRVKVAGADSDYINASYINGYKKKRAYIAAQGPTTKNMGIDFAIFWKMVWQEKVETIVMVTKLHEVTGSKCDQYWPYVTTRSKYAEFVVHCAKEEVFAEFIVRSLTITKGKDTRHINHVNFTAWPDKGVPHDVISIINLRHKVDKMKKMFKESPLLVHCSAGVGRTGTYIALDILTHQGYAEDEIDVFECVVDMRQNRTTMVQTLEQYQFLHHAVLWTLTSDIDPIPSERFVDRSWLNDHKLTAMFNQLQIPNFYDNEEERLSIDVNKKIPFTNRQGADIPGRRHGVSLMMNEMANKSSYINAVYIDGYKTKERFIASMTPLPDTVTDFLGMLLQENVTCIVDLTPIDSEQQDIGEYLPADNQDIENESHVFRITAREVQGCFVKREIEISKKKRGKKADIKTLHHFQFTKWNTNSPLPHSADFVTLVNAVDAATIKMDIAGPIVVHCPSGAKRSGLFCAVWLLIERMTIDRAVSVLNTLRQVKTRRRGAIPNKEQIGFCFDCVDHHLKYLSERVYSNTALQTGRQEMAQV